MVLQYYSVAIKAEGVRKRRTNVFLNTNKDQIQCKKQEKKENKNKKHTLQEEKNKKNIK